MGDCIFCKIANKEASAHIVDENATAMAFLDIFPPTFDGKVRSPAVIVIPKKHYKSDPFHDLPELAYRELFLYARLVARKIQKNLQPLRVCLVVEGMELEHFHIKLYPIFKDTYPGYLSTEKGPGNKNTLAADDYLGQMAARMRQG